MNITQALADYQACLAGLDKLEADHATAVAKLATVRSKIESWLLENAKDLEEVPEFVVESNPSLAWAIGQKNDAFATDLHMTIDDVVIPELEVRHKEELAPLKSTLEAIELWALTELQTRKAKNFKTESGTASMRVDTKYQIADKKLFIDWAVKNNAESELTITLRPNSKFMGQVVETQGELPAGCQSFRENKVVFIRAK